MTPRGGSVSATPVIDTGLPLIGMRIANGAKPGTLAHACIDHLRHLGADVLPLPVHLSATATRAILTSADAWIRPSRPDDGRRLAAIAWRARRHCRNRIDILLRDDGPYTLPASDRLLQAASGMLWLNGRPETPPQPGYGTPAFDCVASYLALGLLLARHALRRRVHRRPLVVYLRRSVACALDSLVPTHFDQGDIPMRLGRHWSGRYRHARTRDGFVSLTTQGDRDTLVAWMQHEGQLSTSDASDDILLHAAVRWATQHSADDIESWALERGLPWHRVRKPADLAAHPQRLTRDVDASPDPSGHDAAIATGHPRRAAAAGAPPLAGIRILDLSWVVAGPLTTRLLADAGAEVVRLEPPQRQGASDAGIGARLHHGKRSIIVDLTRERGRELFLQLAAHVDVVVANFRPRVLEQWGFTETALAHSHPHLITLSMSAYGASGAWSNVPGFAPTLHATVGYDGAMVDAIGQPMGWGFSYSDMSAGCAAAAAIVRALEQRTRSGRGVFIDFAQFDHLARAIERAQAEPSTPPLDVVRCADDPLRTPGERWIAYEPSAASPHEWRIVVDRITRGSTSDDPQASLAAWARLLPPAEVLNRLLAAGVATALVCDSGDLLEPRSPWFLRGHCLPLALSDGRPTKREAAPFTLPGMRTRGCRPLALPGEHTREVLMEWLSLSDGVIDALLRDDVIRSATPGDQKRLEQ